MNAPPKITAAAPLPKLERALPSFLRSLGGVWLLTWRSQVAWRRWPMALLSLLAVPALVAITIHAPVEWTEHHRWAGDAGSEVSNIDRRLSRTSFPLRPDQRTEVLRIFDEEYTRLEDSLPGASQGETQANPTPDQVRGCFETIQRRLRATLDGNQYNRIQGFTDFRLQQDLRKAEEPHWGRTTPFYFWVVDFYFFVILPLSCVRASGALIRDDLQTDTLGFLTTRPLTRARLVVVKFLAQTAWLQIVLLVETMILFGAGAYRHVPALGGFFLLFAGVQILAVFAWSALGTLFGLATRRYLALAILYGALVELGIGRIPTNINTLSLTRHLRTLLAHNAALHNIFDWSPDGTWFSAAALIVAAALFLGLSAALFTFREYHATTEMQK